MPDDVYWKHKYDQLLHVTIDTLLIMRMRKMYLISPEEYNKEYAELSAKMDEIVLQTQQEKGD